MRAATVDSSRAGTKMCSVVVERQRRGSGHGRALGRGSGGAQGTVAPTGLSTGRGARQECWQERRALGETEEQGRLRAAQEMV